VVDVEVGTVFSALPTPAARAQSTTPPTWRLPFCSYPLCSRVPVGLTWHTSFFHASVPVILPFTKKPPIGCGRPLRPGGGGRSRSRCAKVFLIKGSPGKPCHFCPMLAGRWNGKSQRQGSTREEGVCRRLIRTLVDLSRHRTTTYLTRQCTSS